MLKCISPGNHPHYQERSKRGQHCNLDYISLWKGNMDLQYVPDAYCMINYVCSYVLEAAECGMTKSLKQVGKQLNDKEVKYN